MHVDKIQPGQQRFAQLMEHLARLAPPPPSAGEATEPAAAAAQD
jgi:hypothetical protein